jgi:hypothetical protein
MFSNKYYQKYIKYKNKYLQLKYGGEHKENLIDIMDGRTMSIIDFMNFCKNLSEKYQLKHEKDYEKHYGTISYKIILKINGIEYKCICDICNDIKCENNSTIVLYLYHDNKYTVIENIIDDNNYYMNLRNNSFLIMNILNNEEKPYVSTNINNTERLMKLDDIMKIKYRLSCFFEAIDYVTDGATSKGYNLLLFRIIVGYPLENISIYNKYNYEYDMNVIEKIRNIHNEIKNIKINEMIKYLEFCIIMEKQKMKNKIEDYEEKIADNESKIEKYLSKISKIQKEYNEKILGIENTIKMLNNYGKDRLLREYMKEMFEKNKSENYINILEYIVFYKYIISIFKNKIGDISLIGKILELYSILRFEKMVRTTECPKKID